MKNIIFKIKNFLVDIKNVVWQMLSFFLLLPIYLSAKMLDKISSWRFFPQIIRAKMQPLFSAFYNKAINLLIFHQRDSISRIDLIEISIKNMKAKKTRTLITIGGMTIGIAAIVFLVSIGYGLERLVVTRVARLEEMSQMDVSAQAGGKMKINDKSLANFKELTGVKMVLPLIAVVGRVNYQNSVSDMAVYGVTSDYLKQSAIKLVDGEIFNSDAIALDVSQLEESPEVTEEKRIGSVGEEIRDVNFSIKPEEWVAVQETPSNSGKILGYTKRTEEVLQGEEIFGGDYASDNELGSFGKTEDGKTSLGKWIKSSVLLWKQSSCDIKTAGDCEGGDYMVLRDENNKQKQATGYFVESNLDISGNSKVLGESSDASANMDWVNIESESETVKPPETKNVDLAGSSERQAVVNRMMLSVLGINESEAIGKKFKVSFSVVGDLLDDPNQNIHSSETEYTIIGVTPEEKNPIFYVPFIDLRSLGVTNFSQVKMVVSNQSELSKIRKQVEAMGYITHSVADTVAQINSLFATARRVLLLLGTVALAVASLGMFNTLTVSLLERTREVGLMKAIGMKSSEVQELFLTESMIMGFFGGALGIFLGWALGKIVSFSLSSFAIFKGVGFIDVSFIPLPFVLSIIALSLLVGFATGIYPARRAKRISALNALRYE